MSKIIRERINKHGNREITIELEQNEKLKVINPNAFYKLGQPVDDIVQGHIIDEMSRAFWCSAGQCWEV